MNKLKYIASLFVGASCLVACDNDMKYDIPQVESPVLVASNPANNAEQVKVGIDTITLTFDKNIFFSTANTDQILLNGSPVNKADVYGSSNKLSIFADLTRATSYTLTIPEGVITGPNQMPADAVSLSFKTQEQHITGSLCNASATAATQALYASMVSNYGSKIYSATMANVNWNYENATQVYEWTGKYPAINCFDYLHLYASAPGSWIDYSDITPAKSWHDAGGIVAAMWHWNVPVAEGSETMGFYAENNAFSLSEALTEGTWENEVLNADLATMAAHLKLLQDAGIPVLWRPLHEAAGAWFWWGTAGADAYVSLWRKMFTYFQEQGVNNLIWVWTSEGDDEAWYPGDEYVDIIGVDIYNEEDTSAMLETYNDLAYRYPDKMITLSECGSVARLSAQWSGTLYWSWSMPWYPGEDSDGNAVVHADQDWWIDAMNQSYVIARGE